jgi:hypothetical protein
MTPRYSVRGITREVHVYEGEPRLILPPTALDRIGDAWKQYARGETTSSAALARVCEELCVTVGFSAELPSPRLSAEALAAMPRPLPDLDRRLAADFEDVFRKPVPARLYGEDGK